MLFLYYDWLISFPAIDFRVDDSIKNESPPVENKIEEIPLENKIQLQSIIDPVKPFEEIKKSQDSSKTILPTQS